MDVYGSALLDYYQGKADEELWVETSYGEPEEMPMEVFFRSEKDMPDLEIYALELCKGSILDIGAGVGSHTLLMQDAGLDVTALEYSTTLCNIMKQRNIDKIINEDIFKYSLEKYDTLLLLMNGIGLTGNLEGFRKFLLHAKQIIQPGGQLLFDSSDISYLYEDLPVPKSRYFGEISYRYRYKQLTGEWFKWLYLDYNKLTEEASRLGWITQILYEDENGQYLSRLILA